uniref:Uncharacterized protein n=1 Tax=Thermosporothrix sp. COM3 TaxID=2490863 RepID=A0A455SMH1_9CHLR|nr:hypothetical protein KTC_28630 [Thermosporothrix sp. COM3]
MSIATISTTTTPTLNYKELVKKYQLPGTEEIFRSHEGLLVFRQLEGNLKPVYERYLQEKQKAAGIVAIVLYMDRLVIPKTVPQIDKDVHVMICSRTIEVEAGGTLVLPENNPDTEHSIYTQQLTGSLTIQAGSKSVKLEQKDFTALGVKVSYANGKIQQETLKEYELEEYMKWGEPLFRFASTLFQLAAIVCASEKQEEWKAGQAFVKWICALYQAGKDKDAQDLYLHSSNFLANYPPFAATKTILVPVLSQQAQQEEVEAILKALKTYEGYYQTVMNTAKSVADRKAAGNLMLEKSKDVVGKYDQRLKTIQGEIKQKRGYLENMKKKFQDQEKTIKALDQQFQKDIKTWMEARKREALIAAASAVFDFAAAAASAAVTGGATSGAAAAKGVEAGKKVVEAAKKTNELAQKLKQLKEIIAKIVDVLKKLAVMMKQIENARKVIKGKETRLPEVPPATVDLIGGLADWDAFVVDMKAVMKFILDDPGPPRPPQIVGTYQKELEKLAIYGKARLAEQAEVIKAEQEELLLLLEKRVHTNESGRLQKYIDELNEQNKNNTLLLQCLFQSRLYLSVWCFLAFQAYRSAFAYETLSQPEKSPSALQSAGEFESAVAKIIQATNKARATIFPQQTSRNLEIKAATTQPVEQEIIQRLKNDRQVSFILLADQQLMLDQADPAWTALPLPLKTNMFDEKQRVRVVRLRCILEGVPLKVKQHLKLYLEVAGLSMDRKYQNAGIDYYTFAVPPWRLVFEYRPKEQSDPPNAKVIRDTVLGLDRIITTDGEIEVSQQKYYYQPTPFTTWNLRLSGNKNDLPLDQLSALRLEWVVSAGDKGKSSEQEMEQEVEVIFQMLQESE